MDIELSPVVIGGLQSLNNSLNMELSKKLISNAVKMALHSDSNIPSNPEIYASKPDVAKQAEYSVLTILFLAVKHNMDNAKLRSILEKNSVSNVAIEEIIHTYDLNKYDLVVHNLSTGHSLPHITDIAWKLTCDIKSSSKDKDSGELLYKVILGNFNERNGEKITIADFSCNREELQSFVNKLKEIQRHCESLN